MKDNALNIPILYGLNTAYITCYKHFVDTLELYQRRYTSRQQLKKLGPEHLRDVGISPAQAQQEAKKAFWES